MSMVTLQNEVNNYKIDLGRMVRINSLEVIQDEYTFCPLEFMYPEQRRKLSDMHGMELTIQDFMDKYPLWADDFEWIMSKDQTTLTHMDLGLTEIRGNLKFAVWMELILI